MWEEGSKRVDRNREIPIIPKWHFDPIEKKGERDKHYVETMKIDNDHAKNKMVIPKIA